MSGGYFNSDAFPRPAGTIPVITDPRNPAAKVGGAAYPVDGVGPVGRSFENRGTSEPKFDARVDQELSNGGRLTYEGGVSGTSGIIYTGVGPFDIQSGTYLGFGRVNYSRNAFKASFFINALSADAPNLMFPDPATGKPLQLTLTTQTYDFEAGDARPIGRHQVLSYGGNIRRNNFDITLAPKAQDRNEIGGYVQDEIVLDKFRFNIGGRVDKFGNLDDPVFSPRLAALFNVLPDHSVRFAFNRAFRSPSVINNYLEANIVAPQDLSALAPILPPPLRPLVANPFPLVVRAVGSELPIGSTPQPKLTEESVTAYEIAYTGTIKKRSDRGICVLRERSERQHQFRAAPVEPGSLHGREPAARLAAAASHPDGDGAMSKPEKAVDEPVQVGLIVRFDTGDPAVEAFAVAADHHLGEPADVIGEGVQVRARGPDLLDHELVIGIAAVGVTQDRPGHRPHGGRWGHRGRRGAQGPERAQVAQHGAQAAAVALAADLGEQRAAVGVSEVEPVVQVGLELIEHAGPPIPRGGQQVLHRAGAGEAAHRLLRQAELPHDGLDPLALLAQILHRRIALPGPDSQRGGLPTGERGLRGELPEVRWGIRLRRWAVLGRLLGPAAAVAGHRLLRVFGEVVPQGTGGPPARCPRVGSFSDGPQPERRMRVSPHVALQ